MLPEEQAFALTDEKSPAYITVFYQILIELYKDQEKIIEAFRTGKGLGWGDHHTSSPLPRYRETILQTKLRC